MQQLCMHRGHCKMIMDVGARGWIILNTASDTCGCLGDNVTAPRYIMEM